MKAAWFVLILTLLLPAGLRAAPKTIHVFVALCDNETQGIAPVGAKIGDGDKPEANLYWGCTDGLASYFNRSKCWNLVKSEKDVTKDLLVRLRFQHASADLQLTADAYRGSAMRQCMEDFEKTVAAGNDALVAYIGHNALMDFELKPPAVHTEKQPDAVVLCCKSEAWFRQRLGGLGARPILLTDQFMYPGSFLLHDAIEAWRQGEGLGPIRAAAGRAYARNQKISVKAATGVFSDLEKKK